MSEPYTERLWTATDSVRIFIRDYAAGLGAPKLPVVCLHGLTRNSKDFEEIAGVIAASGRRVFVPDMRGRGRSGYDPKAMNYVPSTYARDVIGLLEAFGVSRAVFLGTSMGGVITMVVAARRSRMVAAAILNDIGPEAAPEGITRISGYAGKPVNIENWDDAVAYVREINAPAFPRYDDEAWLQFARRTFRDDGAGRPVLDYDPGIRAPIEAGKLKLPKFIAWWIFKRLARRRPTLVVRGGLSDILSAQIVRRMQKTAPGLEVAEIPAVGHAPLLNEPRALVAIKSFLDRVP
jgi:pimeloyl-ACP methyl ester carboxylesterase